MEKNILQQNYETYLDRKINPVPNSFTNVMFDRGVKFMCKKIGEEATEVVMAAIADNKTELVLEIADLVYMVQVLMVEKGITNQDIEKVLIERSKVQGNSKLKISTVKGGKQDEQVDIRTS